MPATDYPRKLRITDYFSKTLYHSSYRKDKKNNSNNKIFLHSFNAFYYYTNSGTVAGWHKGLISDNLMKYKVAKTIRSW